MPRSKEPYLWALFSGGGMAAALMLPAIALLLWVAAPLGWIELGHDALATLFLHPITRVVLFGLITASLFHAAHRFRYTLYDGLQLYHLNALIAVLTYGLATALTVATAVVAFGM